MAIIATGSKTIIDFSDGKSLSVYLGSNMPRTQIYDVNASSYSPNWASTALVITPVVYANQTAIALDSAALSITWKRKEGSGSEAVLVTGETVAANVLTVSANKLSGVTSGLLTYIAYVTYTDPDTGLPINATADITFAMVTTGANAKSAWISGEQVFKYAVSGGAANPTQITLTANLQNVTMVKWQYKNGSGVWTDYPTTADNATITGTTLVVKPTHAIWNGESATIQIVTSDANIGDVTSIYKVTDGATGATGQYASVAFLSNENITFAANKDGQIAAVTVTCNVVAYTGTTKVTPTVGTITGAPTGMTVTKGSATGNEIPISIAITANATLGAATPLQGTLSVPITAPVNTTLQITWSKVNTGATGATGAAAKVAIISPSSELFKSVDGGATYTPSTIVLTPSFQAVTFSKWQYSVDGGTTFADVVSGTTSGCTIASGVLTLANSSTLFTASVTAVTFKLVSSDSTITDSITVHKLADGLSGMSVLLSNEAHTLPKTTAGTVTYTGSGTTIRVFEGATELAYDGTGTANGTWKVTTAATGITCGSLTDSGTYLTVGDHSAMGGSTASIKYTVSGKRASGVAFSIEVSQTFSISLQGITGQNAIVFSLFAPSGTVFTNHSGTLTIQSAGYDGSTLISSGATYLWEKYSSGSWTTVSGQTTSSLSVDGSTVTGMASFRCTMTYGGKTYQDIITLIDKTDNYQADIDSTAGDVFKNTVGSTCLICRLWQNGAEVDPLKSTTYSTTAPGSPTTGTFYYKITTSAPATALMRYSGSAWVDVTTDATYKHTKTYKWYRRDKDGNPLDSGAVFATGKVIYIDGDDVDNKTVFVCEVE